MFGWAYKVKSAFCTPIACVQQGLSLPAPCGEISLPLPRRQKRPERSPGSSTFSPSRLELGLPGWLLESLLEVFIPWHRSNCCKIHRNSSAEKWPPPWLHSAKHLHFYQKSWWQSCMLCLLLASLPPSSVVSLFIFSVTPDLQQCNLDQNQALRHAPTIHIRRSLHFITRNLLDFYYLQSNQQSLVQQCTGGALPWAKRVGLH